MRAKPEKGASLCGELAEPARPEGLWASAVSSLFRSFFAKKEPKKFQSKVPRIRMHIRAFQPHGNAQRLIHAAHVIGRDTAGALAQAALV